MKLRSRLRHFLPVVFALGLLTAAFAAPDRAAIVQRVRAELATILKKDATKLPVDKPVLALGADDLDIVEWVMAVEEAFHVSVPEDKVLEPKTDKVRKDFSIASMVAIVMEAPQDQGTKKK